MSQKQQKFGVLCPFCFVSILKFVIFKYSFVVNFEKVKLVIDLFDD